MSDTPPDFDQVTDALRLAESDSDAAECHGGLCGLICTVEELDKDYWLNITIPKAPGSQIDPKARELLGDLFDSTARQMQSEDFAFSLLLPSDDSGMYTRLEALASWCQGFLAGLSYGGLTDLKKLPGELPEVVEDLLNISRADSYELDDEEEDESAYMELVEYVRMAILLFREEMREFLKGNDTHQHHEGCDHDHLH